MEIMGTFLVICGDRRKNVGNMDLVRKSKILALPLTRTVTLDGPLTSSTSISFPNQMSIIISVSLKKKSQDPLMTHGCKNTSHSRKNSTK